MNVNEKNDILINKQYNNNLKKYKSASSSSVNSANSSNHNIEAFNSNPIK